VANAALAVAPLEPWCARAGQHVPSARPVPLDTQCPALDRPAHTSASRVASRPVLLVCVPGLPRPLLNAQRRSHAVRHRRDGLCHPTGYAYYLRQTSCSEVPLRVAHHSSTLSLCSASAHASPQICSPLLRVRPVSTPEGWVYSRVAATWYRVCPMHAAHTQGHDAPQPALLRRSVQSQISAASGPLPIPVRHSRLGTSAGATIAH